MVLKSCIQVIFVNIVILEELIQNVGKQVVGHVDFTHFRRHYAWSQTKVVETETIPK